MAAVPSRRRASFVEPRSVAAEASAAHDLYERHAARLHGYCLHQLGSREEAEDAVQTTFMNAFRALGKGVKPEAEAAWLFKIAENVCLSRRRSSWRRNRIESPADFELIEELVPGPNRQRDELIGLEDALAALPGQQRRAILLREWQGLSYREISAELELSQSAVETLIFRARRSLAHGLTQPERVRPPQRLRRALNLVDPTTLLATVKSLLAGTAALKATTAAVVVTAAAGTAVTVAGSDAGPPPKPALAVSALPPLPPLPRAVPVAAVASAPPAAVPAVVERTSAARRRAAAVPSVKKQEGDARPASERKAARCRGARRTQDRACRDARRAEVSPARAAGGAEDRGEGAPRRAEGGARRTPSRAQGRPRRAADAAAGRPSGEARRAKGRAGGAPGRA